MVQDDNPGGVEPRETPARPHASGAGPDRGDVERRAQGGAPTPPSAPTPPAPAPPPLPPQVVEGRVVGPPHYPQPARLVVWWNRPATILLVVAVLLLLLLLTSALAVQALTRDGIVPAGAADPSPQPAPTPTSQESPVPPAAPAGPSASPTSAPAQSTPEPGAVSLPPVPPGTVGEPHYSDRLELRADSLGKDFDHVANLPSRRDIAALAYGITGISGAWLGVYGDESDPILSDCAEIPSKDWVFTVPVAELVRGLRICYLTGDGRYGYLTVTEVELDLNGDLLELVGAFGTWKKLPGQD